MLILYQFPISHYCEKVRWALAYKELDHSVRNLLPGFHARKMTTLAPRSSVPVLVHDAHVIQGSASIISYLDQHFPGQSLTPGDEKLKTEALQWEAYVDEEIGPHIRRCCYHVLLDYPEIVTAFFSSGGPWYGRFVLPVIFPKLKARMQDRMQINEDTVQTSKQHLHTAIDRLHSHLQDNAFLAGDNFTRADLAAAALLAPFRQPAKYGLDWPATVPPPLQALFDEFQAQLGWVDRVYAAYR